MSEFEEFIKAKYPVDYESLKEKYPKVPVVEFYGDELDVWNYKQSEIDQFKVVCAKAMQLEIQHRTMLQDSLLEVEKLKAEKAGFQKLVKSLRSEFDLNGGGDQVERQIELLEEALRGEHE